MINRNTRIAIGFSVLGVLVAGFGIYKGTHDAGSGQSSDAVTYETAMERCALSRLKNAGVFDPTPDSPRYFDAYTACTYGTTYDHVTAPGRGWGPADSGYWAP